MSELTDRLIEHAKECSKLFIEHGSTCELKLREDITQAADRIDKLEADHDAGWRGCIDHLIKPEHPCPVCRIERLTDALKRLGSREKMAEDRGNNLNTIIADYLARIDYANKALEETQ